MYKLLFSAIVFTLFVSCQRNGSNFDASGTFEADEVIVSSFATGKILSLAIDEGSILSKDSIVGLVDPTGLNLQKEEVQATIAALQHQTVSSASQERLLEDQIKVQSSQLQNLEHERARIENLLKSDAATGKQLDDINAQIDVMRKQIDVTRQQINVQKSNTGTQNRSILSQAQPLQKRISQIEDELSKTAIRNPVNGTVLTKYAMEGEIISAGKPIYKVADLSELTLRAYISGSQLSQVKLGQTVKVKVDDGSKKYREMIGTISWIADKAEFTPKTIQTKDERVNLVYAIKIRVKNDGYLKIGMYGEVNF